MFIRVILYVLVNNAITMIQASNSSQLRFAKAYPHDKSTKTIIS